MSDIEVSITTSTPNVTVTITSAVSDITWTFDHVDQSWSGTSHTIDTSTLANGYHDLLITAQKSDGYYYSYHAQITVNH